MTLNWGGAGDVTPGQQASTADQTFVVDLVATYGTDLERYARRLCGDWASAEDLVQETLMRAWRHASATRGQRAGRAWLFTIMRNAAIDVRRARWARPAETGPEALDRIPVANSSEDRILETWIVIQALASLSENHRKVILQLYYRQSSVAEAAEILAIPQGTVKSRAYYALRAMRKILEMQGISSPGQQAQAADVHGGSTSASTSSAPSDPSSAAAPSVT